MRFFLIFGYILFLSLSVVLLKLNREIKYIVMVLIFIYFLLIALRITYPLIFTFFDISHEFFLFLGLSLLFFFRFFFYLEPIYLRIKSWLNFKNTKFGLFYYLIKISEEKAILCRSFFKKERLFFLLLLLRKTLSKISSKFLISLFFVPSLIFYFFFIKETLDFSYSISFWLFSLSLLWQRLYPKFLLFCLGYGNLLFLYKNTADRESQLHFFDNLESLFTCFSMGFWLFGCFQEYPLPSDKTKAEVFCIEANKLYVIFFTARNWFIFVRKLEILKQRLFSLVINLFFLALIFLKTELILTNYLFISPNYVYLALSLSFILFWFFLNRELITFCLMPVNTMTLKFQYRLLPKFLDDFNSFYKLTQTNFPLHQR